MPNPFRRFASLLRPFDGDAGAPPRTFGAFLRWAFGGAWRVIWVAAFVSFCVGLAEAAGALLIGWVIDTALATGAAPFFDRHWPALLAIALFFVILRPALMTLSAAMNGVAIAPNIFPLVFTRLNRHTLGQSLRFFDDDFAGRLTQKQIQTASSLTEVVMESTNAFAFAAATILGAVLVLGGVNGWLAVILILWLVAYALFIRWYLPRIRIRAKARAAARAAATGQVVDTLSNMATVKLFANTDREEVKVTEAISEFRERALDFGEFSVVFRGTLMTLAGVLPVLMLGGALILWRYGAASAGDIAVAGVLSTRIAQMSGWISFTAMGVFANLGEAEDGMKTLSPPHDVTDRPGAQPIARAVGAIRFDAVTYQYGRSEEGSGGLIDVTLDVAPGEKVALVGRSGAGKSTALSLLLRLYDVEAGAVRLDGVDIRDFTQNTLRRQVAMVRQETAMFNRSALENIRYGRPEASDEEVQTAARRASAHEFILELADLKGRRGYDAHLGERGVKLSGGQRQRIALARAILKDAPVLALDEATSALDSEVEQQIQTSLQTLMQGRTVIAIAHRLSTIAHMDRIVVLEGGRIAEMGDHDALLAKGGLYAGFWRRQSGGFLDLKAAE